jgi:hypothetical protein
MFLRNPVDDQALLDAINWVMNGILAGAIEITLPCGRCHDSEAVVPLRGVAGGPAIGSPDSFGSCCTQARRHRTVPR